MGWEVERHSSEVLALTANSFWNLGVAGCYIVIEPELVGCYIVIEPDSELDSEAQHNDAKRRHSVVPGKSASFSKSHLSDTSSSRVTQL